MPLTESCPSLTAANRGDTDLPRPHDRQGQVELTALWETAPGRLVRVSRTQRGDQKHGPGTRVPGVYKEERAKLDSQRAMPAKF